MAATVATAPRPPMIPRLDMRRARWPSLTPHCPPALPPCRRVGARMRCAPGCPAPRPPCAGPRGHGRAAEGRHTRQRPDGLVVEHHLGAGCGSAVQLEQGQAAAHLGLDVHAVDDFLADVAALLEVADLALQAEVVHDGLLAAVDGPPGLAVGDAGPRPAPAAPPAPRRPRPGSPRCSPAPLPAPAHRSRQRRSGPCSGPRWSRCRRPCASPCHHPRPRSRGRRWVWAGLLQRALPGRWGPGR